MKGEHAEALQAVDALDLRAAVERSDARRIEHFVRRADEIRVAVGVGIEILRALREERAVLDELAFEFLRRDRLLIDLDV